MNTASLGINFPLSSVFSVLCHGCPTVQNMVFLYNKEDIPVDAKVGKKKEISRRSKAIV